MLLASKNNVTLKAPDLAPLVEGDHVDLQLLGDRRHALTMGWVHPPEDIGFDAFAVTTHQTAQSSPLVNGVVRMERSQLFWQGVDVFVGQ